MSQGAEMTLIERLRSEAVHPSVTVQMRLIAMKAADAIEALQAENERLETEAISYKVAWERACDAARDVGAERDALAAKLATLEADAERYRWLREQHDEDEGKTLWHVRGSIGAPILNGMLDAAIDAAKGGQHDQS